MVQAAESIVTATWVAAGAAIAAVIVAVVQVARDVYRAVIGRRTVTARIQTLAYQLLRQLRSWVGKPNGGEDFESWIRQGPPEAVGEHLDRAEQRIDHLMSLRPDGSRQVGQALDRAYISFLEGTRRLNQYVATPRPNVGAELVDWIQLRVDAEKDLRDCIAEIERHVVGHGILTAERDLAQRRAIENPINQGAAELAALARAQVAAETGEKADGIVPQRAARKKEPGDDD